MSTQRRLIERESTDFDITSANDGLVALVTAIRWGTTVLGLIWAATLDSRVHDMLFGTVLVVWAIWRTFRPIEYRAIGWKGLLPIVFEATGAVVAIVGTGCWDSPYLFTLMTPTIAAAFARGFWHSARIGVTCSIAVGVAAQVIGLESAIQPIGAWSAELILAATLGAFGRHLLLRAQHASALNISEAWRLQEVNALLVGLNRVANDLSATFDVQETVNNALCTMNELTSPDAAAVLLWDQTGDFWRTEASMGSDFADSYPPEALPEPIFTDERRAQPQLVELGTQQQGIQSWARSAIYVPLWASQRCTGIVVLESTTTQHFNAAHLDAVANVADTIALTIDNARWFERLRARGAAQERNRIARDLHDRVSQGIAYVTFELERIARGVTHPGLQQDLMRLHADTKSIVTELRETLHDLRADVGDNQRLETVMEDFLLRVERRSHIAITSEFADPTMLALPIEREVWRIAQEAVLNAERHAQATEIGICWRTEGDWGVLTITDNGIGINVRAAVADNDQRRYGIVGMRERAESIGGTLNVTNISPSGTQISLRVPVMGSEFGSLAIPTIPMPKPADQVRERDFGYRPRRTPTTASTNRSPEHG